MTNTTNAEIIAYLRDKIEEHKRKDEYWSADMVWKYVEHLESQSVKVDAMGLTYHDHIPGYTNPPVEE